MKTTAEHDLIDRQILLTIREVAALMRVSDDTVRRRIADGTLPRRLVIRGLHRRQLLFPREALTRWLDNGCPR